MLNEQSYCKQIIEKIQTDHNLVKIFTKAPKLLKHINAYYEKM